MEEEDPTEINFERMLGEIFPQIPLENIRDIIMIVEEQNPLDSQEGKIENMINLLSGDGAQGPIPQIVPTVETSVNEELKRSLALIYPDCDPQFLSDYCQEKPPSFSLDRAMEEFNQDGYEKVQVDPITIWMELKDTFPDADPSYLEKEARKFALLPPQALSEFVQNAVEKHDYPTMQDYLKSKKENDELAIYKTRFNVDKYLEAVPDPVTLFSDPKRKLALADDVDENDVRYAMAFLLNQYRLTRRSYIEKVFKWKNKNLVEVCDCLDKLGRSLKKARPFEQEGDTSNVGLLQVVTYLRNRKLIKRMIKMRDDSYRLAKEEARKYNLLETCQTCFDDELIPEECYFCMKDCVFCKDCVKTGTENVIGKGEIKFPCFNNCGAEFSFQTLQMVLPKNIFERLTQRSASEEIKKANVDGLETCPFCDFAMVLPENEKIFKCINEECLIESCRQCRHKSHIPLRCNEIEYDEDVRRRTFIENKMTEALTRTCYSCHKPFIKTSGCNKMTCNCGAKMCYLCGAAIQDYSHFGEGKCALHTNDTEVNLRRILENAQKAKNELGDVEIKFDPTVNIQEFYQN
nr:E3 ubiquitin-protein ligase RNF216-like [Leptinotarsa decemlineata]